MRRPFLLGVIAVTFLAVSCRERKPPARRVESSTLPAVQVTAQAKMLFTFATEEGKFETMSELAKVPEARRGWVRVVDLQVKPDQRLDVELVYVADLRAPRKDGSYPYVVMSRGAFEAAALSRARAGATEPPPRTPTRTAGAKVILYATSWCPACRSARAYMQSKGIPFVEKDIEKDSAAASELMEKAKAAGVSASGVPVLDINGSLMQGFDPQRLDELLGAKS